jgi:hypothetical protein
MAADPTYAHYRVERTLSDVDAESRKDVRKEWPPRPRPGGRAPTYRDMATSPKFAVHDVVQILDREGRSVWSTSFDLRADGERFEAALLDDVLHLDVDEFRAKYGLTGDSPRDLEVPEGPAGPGGAREGDVDWGDFGQR